MFRSLVTAVAAVGLIVVTVGVTPTQAAAGDVQAQAGTSSLRLLDRLPVKSEVSGGYSRTKFGGWLDADRDGCNTRAEVLRSEATRKPRVAGGCRLVGGKWTSVYDRQVVTKASKLDIDHVVPLAEAWQSGGYRWNPATRRAFANDLGYGGSLIAVTARTNRSKGDRQPGQWNPPSKQSRCRYYGTWVRVKYRWSLSVDPVEKATLRRYLTSCGSAANQPTPSKAAVRTTAGTKPPAPRRPDNSAGKNDPRFSTCGEAIKHGYGPYRRDRDPEYAWYRDQDRDGVVCE